MKCANQLRHVARAAAAALLATGLAQAPGALAQENHTGHDMSAMDPHAHHAHPDKSAPTKRSMVDVTVTATPMVRQDGSKTTLARELEGNKPVILAFIYTSCTTVCPVTSQILSRTQDLLGNELKNVRMLSISIDPEYDTPERLLAYAKNFEAKPQWQHYSGTLANSVAIQKAFGAYRGDKMNHVPLMFINGGGKRSWVQIEGFPSAEQVVKEYRDQRKS
ncbi:SCO family protein [Rhodoferax lacus]|uniref:SCO family protein n=1 Tax=Rhodoferax lacus TaxID=2184758 RepID=A0A3E1RFH3_9BURK|nr:SCO family protein [Rhodoferax lacus]RFO98117.1 SCO family protein [Rhodoferax lacus]